MEHEELNEWIHRYRSYLLNLHEPKYFANANRDKYLLFFQNRLLKFSLIVQDDPYQLNILDLFKEGSYLNESLPNILQKIDKRRIWWKDQMYFGQEYSQPYYKVTGSVKDESKRTVLKFLVQAEIVIFFIEFIGKLKKANKRGAIGMQEQKDLFAKAKEGILPPKKESPQPLVGFFWEGRDVSMKIQTLFNGLISGEFLERKTSFEKFSGLFKGVPVAEPVKWCGTVSQLVYLIGELYNKNLLSKTDTYGSWLYSKLSACFTDKQGKRLQAKNLKQTKSDIENKERFPAKGDMLHNLVLEVLNTTFLKSIESEEKKN